MLWQLAYAEFHFTSVLWRIFEKENFFDAIQIFNTENAGLAVSPTQSQLMKAVKMAALWACVWMYGLPALQAQRLRGI